MNVLTYWIFCIFLFPHIQNPVNSKYCTKTEDCVKENNELLCALCEGEYGSAQCINPFPEIYVIDASTLGCTYKIVPYCDLKKPCLNNGICHNSQEISYYCHCTQGFVGRNCEKKYDKIGYFNLFKIFMSHSVQINNENAVTIALELQENEKINKMTIMTGKYYSNFHFDEQPPHMDCRESICSFSVLSSIRYQYKPYEQGNKDFYFLGDNLLGYKTNFQVNVVHRDTSIFEAQFSVFARYPETYTCVPHVTLGECGESFDNPTTYTTLSQIMIESFLQVIPNGNSRVPVIEQDSGHCDDQSGINVAWAIYWLRGNLLDDEVVVNCTESN
jgi:hypothetical protein